MPVVFTLVALLALIGFWWLSMWILLAGRLKWRELLPAAVVTAMCWIGMEFVFRLTFSSSVIADDHKYGPIGVVFAFMSYLIAIGVVLIIGAVFSAFRRDRKVLSAAKSPS